VKISGLPLWAKASSSLGVEGGNVFYDDTGLPYLSKKSTHAIDCIVAVAMTTGRADAGHGGPSICQSVEKRPHELSDDLREDR
jgi:hypothetical protein